MEKKYSISQDGVIYSVNPDLTITKYGRIGPDGQLTAIDGTPLQGAAPQAPAPEPQVVRVRRPVWGYWLVIILLLLAGGCGYYVFMHEYEQLEKAEHQIRELKVQAASDAGTLRQKEKLIEQLQHELETINRSRFQAEKTLEEVSSQASAFTPILVTGVTFRNISNVGKPLSNFGAPLHAADMRYIQPQVSYYGMATGMRTFKVRIIGPNGPMGTGDYAFTAERPIDKGTGHSFVLSGFGYSDRGWAPGTYRYEIWYGQSLIAKKFVTVS